jgi:hypothetical protein
MTWDEQGPAIMRRAEEFAHESRGDGSAQRNWARSCPERVRAVFGAIRANTPEAYARESWRDLTPVPHDPTMTLHRLSRNPTELSETRSQSYASATAQRANDMSSICRKAH